MWQRKAYHVIHLGTPFNSYSHVTPKLKYNYTGKGVLRSIYGKDGVSKRKILIFHRMEMIDGYCRQRKNQEVACFKFYEEYKDKENERILTI